MDDTTVKGPSKLIVATQTLFLSGAAAAASIGALAATSEPKDFAKSLPGMGDVAPGVENAGAEVPALYVLAAAICVCVAFSLVGLSMMTWLVLRVFKLSKESTAEISRENRLVIESMTADNRHANETARTECHRHNETVATESRLVTEKAAEAATACAVALGRCGEVIDRLESRGR